MMDRKHCVGCRENFYNGDNPFGIVECWSLKDAVLISRKEVPVDQRPPWTQGPVMKPSCYRRKGYVYVKPGQTQ